MSAVRLNKFILDFFNELNISHVKYCHFKSNNNIVPALNGVDDLDLLIALDDIDEFNSVLAKFRFRIAFDRGEQATPYVFHFFSMDPDTGLLVHLHVYYKLISGGSIVKNHWFQLENLLLSTAINSDHGTIKISSHEADLIFFVIRKFIEQPSLVENYLFLKDYKNIKQEYDWLKQNSNHKTIEELVKNWLPALGLHFFNECCNELSRKGRIVQKFLLGVKMRKHFNTTVIPSTIASFKRSYYFGTALLKGRLGFSRKNRFCFPGGKLISFVGSEASGKSTSSQQISQWLGERFDTHLIHVGKPKKNWRTKPLWLMINVAVRLKKLIFSSGSANYNSEQVYDRVAENMPHPLICLLDSFDRKYWVRKHVAFKFQGAIIITDRYPSEGYNVLDGPRIQGTSTLARLMSKVERANYKSLPSPDLIFKLQAPLNVTLRRNQGRQSPEPEAYVKKRYEMAAQISFDRSLVVDIDSSLPIDETIKIIKNYIWKGKR